jgi:hypothetical protein
MHKRKLSSHKTQVLAALKTHLAPLFDVAHANMVAVVSAASEHHVKQGLQQQGRHPFETGSIDSLFAQCQDYDTSSGTSSEPENSSTSGDSVATTCSSSVAGGSSSSTAGIAAARAAAAAAKSGDWRDKFDFAQPRSVGFGLLALSAAAGIVGVVLAKKR